mmetsp:Transcript_18954/g.43991  ORF Transcript_18954/g.43991 Transcript_18954/m.43991 type:complete len:261 (-) Transcript_18954:2090-2872(-)
MGVDARGEDRVVVGAKLGVLSQVRVLVAGLPIVKDPPAGGALEGLDLVLDIEIDAVFENLGYQRVLAAGNLVQGIQGPVGADEVGVLEGFFRGHALARIEGEELPNEMQQEIRRRIESDSEGVSSSQSAVEILQRTRFLYHGGLVQGVSVPEGPAVSPSRVVRRYEDAKVREGREVQGVRDLVVGRPGSLELVGQQGARPLVHGKDVGCSQQQLQREDPDAPGIVGVGLFGVEGLPVGPHVRLGRGVLIRLLTRRRALGV